MDCIIYSNLILSNSRLLVGSKTSAITKTITGALENSAYYKAYQNNMDEKSYIGNPKLRLETLKTGHHTTLFNNEAYVTVSNEYSNCLVRFLASYYIK